MEKNQTKYFIRRISNLENHAEYAAELIRWAEASSEPLLFPGLLSGWPALSLWSGPEGLARLKQLAGETEIQVMMSSSRVFFGDISRHQPATMSFGQLLAVLEAMPLRPPSTPQNTSASDAAATECTKQAADGVDCDASTTSNEGYDGGQIGTIDSGSSSGMTRSGAQGSDNDSDDSGSSSGNSSTDSLGKETDGKLLSSARKLHVYLAQQPLTGGLSALQDDVPLPACLYGKNIATTNLWMCGGHVRSSLHYDPHHNLLAVVRGRKVVTVVPPYLTHCVYPMTLAGDAPNHSQVPFADSQPAAHHPAYMAAIAASAVVELKVGDALFLPEGWWHQVDSGPETTFAVNFWWRSALTDLLAAPQPPLPQPPPLPGPSAAAEAAKEASPQPARTSTAVGARSSWSNPGPGLRNLFVLRQLTGAAIEDIVESLLAAVMPPPSNCGPYEDLTADTTAAAVQLLSNALQGRMAAVGAADDAAAEVGAPPLLAPHVVGLLLQLRPGEATALGLSACPTAAALAALTPRQLAAALYRMCRTTPDLVSELLTQRCRVPVVACLLTRAFDQLGTAPAATNSATSAAFSKRAVGTATAAASAGAGVGTEDRAGGAMAWEDGTAVAVDRATARWAGYAAYGSDGSARVGVDYGCGHEVGKKSFSAEGKSTEINRDAHEQRVWKRRRCSMTSTASDEQQRHGGKNVSPIETVREYGVVTRRRSSSWYCGNRNGDGGGNSGKENDAGMDAVAGCHHHGGGGGGDGDGAGGGAAAAADKDSREGSAGGGGSGSADDDARDGDRGSVENDFFELLYSTVDDPDKVFQLFLEGRAALSATARRILLESVLT